MLISQCEIIIIPIYKSGDCKTIKNSRPVSVLPVFSKVFERIMYNIIFSFLKYFTLLYKFNLYFVKNMELIWL